MPATSSPQRLVWLDLLRGFAVLGMTFVNAAIILHDERGAQVPAVLLHSEWTGFTLADAIFPIFVLAVGLSADASLQGSAAADRPRELRRVMVRTLRLLLLGLLVSNLGLVFAEPGASFRLMGVLQRLGLVYLAAAIAVLYLPRAWRLAVAGALLLGYAGLLTVRPPDGLLDLARPGLDLPAWVDRALLGRTIYVDGPHGYDPEGLLSTIPSVAEGLIGAALLSGFRGPWPRRLPVVLAGLLAIALGVALGRFEPISKAVWTPTFVLVSAGVGVVLAMILLLLDQTRIASTVLRWTLLPAGLNAITAYVLQEVGGEFLGRVPLAWGERLGLSPAGAAMGVVVLFTALVWACTVLLRRLGVRIRL